MSDLGLEQIQFPNSENTYHIPSNFEKEYEYQDIIMTLTYHTAGSDIYTSPSTGEKNINLLMYLSNDGLNFAKVGTIKLDKEILPQGNNSLPYSLWDFSVIWYKDKWLIAYDYIDNDRKNKLKELLNDESEADMNLGGNSIGILETKDFINFVNYKIEIPEAHEYGSATERKEIWASTWAPDLFADDDGTLYMVLTTSSWTQKFINMSSNTRFIKDGVYILKLDPNNNFQINDEYKIRMPYNEISSDFPATRGNYNDKNDNNLLNPDKNYIYTTPNYIDGHIYKSNGTYYFIIKDETNVRQQIYQFQNFPTTLITADGVITNPDEPADFKLKCYNFHEIGEGMSVIKFKERYLAYSDKFMKTTPSNVRNTYNANGISVSCLIEKDVYKNNKLTTPADLLTPWTSSIVTNVEGDAWNRHCSMVSITYNTTKETLKQRKSIFDFIKTCNISNSNFLEVPKPKYYRYGITSDDTEINSLLLQPNATYLAKGNRKIIVKNIEPFFMNYGDTCNFAIEDNDQTSFIFLPSNNLIVDNGNNQREELDFNGSKTILQLKQGYTKSILSKDTAFPRRAIKLIQLYDDIVMKGVWRLTDDLKNGRITNPTEEYTFVLRITDIKTIDGDSHVEGYVIDTSRSILLINPDWSKYSKTNGLEIKSGNIITLKISEQTKFTTMKKNSVTWIVIENFNEDNNGIEITNFATEYATRAEILEKPLPIRPNVLYYVADENQITIKAIDNKMFWGDSCSFVKMSGGNTANIIFDKSNYSNSTEYGIWWFQSERNNEFVIDKPFETTSLYCTTNWSGNRVCTFDKNNVQRNKRIYLVDSDNETITYDSSNKLILKPSYVYSISGKNRNAIIKNVSLNNLMIGESCLFVKMSDNPDTSIVFQNESDASGFFYHNTASLDLKLDTSRTAIRLTKINDEKAFLEYCSIIPESMQITLPSINIDSTLTIAGAAAEAVATGNRINDTHLKINNLKSQINDLNSIISNTTSEIKELQKQDNKINNLQNQINNITNTNTTQIKLDETLSKKGYAAEAESLGISLSNIKSDINKLKDVAYDKADSNAELYEITADLATKTRQVLWIDGENGNDERDGSNYNKSLKTIEEALKRNSGGSLVLFLAPATYTLPSGLKFTDYTRNKDLEILGWHSGSTRDTWKKPKLTSAQTIVMNGSTTYQASTNSYLTSYSGLTNDQKKILYFYFYGQAYTPTFKYENNKLIETKLEILGPRLTMGNKALSSYFDSENWIYELDDDNNKTSTSLKCDYNDNYPPGSKCNLWHDTIKKLVPVKSLILCQTYPGTWYYDDKGTIWANFIPEDTKNINLHFKLLLPEVNEITDEMMNTLVGDAQEIINENNRNAYYEEKDTNLIHIEGYNLVKITDIDFDYGPTNCLYVKTCPNLVVTSCKFSYAGKRNGVFLDTIYIGNFHNCEGKYNRIDGFGITGPGSVSFVDCQGHHNWDDGISHHMDGCSGTIIGGKYYYNGKGGISSPSHLSSNEIIGAEVHHNRHAGIYAIRGTISNAPYGYPKLNVSNCYIHDEKYGIRSDSYEVDCWNCIFKNNTQNTFEDTVTLDEITTKGRINIYNPTLSISSTLETNNKILFNKKPKVVLLGDSVVAGHGATDYNNKSSEPIINIDPDTYPNLRDDKRIIYLSNSSYSWATQFKNYIETYYPGSNVINKGWPGITIWELNYCLNSLLEDRKAAFEADPAKPYDYAIVQVGINSILSLSADNFKSALKKDDDGNPYIWNGTPLNNKGEEPSQDEIINDLNTYCTQKMTSNDISACEDFVSFNSKAHLTNLKQIITKLRNANIIPIMVTNTPIESNQSKTKTTVVDTYYYETDSGIYYSRYNKDFTGNNSDVPSGVTTKRIKFPTRIIENGSEKIKAIIIQACEEAGAVCLDMQSEINWYLFEKDKNLNDYLSDILHPNDEGYKLIFNLYKKLLNA